MDRQIPQNISREISDKFQIADNTFSRDVKTNPKDRIQVEIGDAKQPDFKPQAKIMRWDNEVNFSIRAEEKAGATVETEGEKIKYITPEYEVHQYDKPDAGEDGGFEFEWVLKEPPKTNVLTATIQTKGLDFFYQAPYNEQEMPPEDIAAGVVTRTETQGLDSSGNVIINMPENVVGSYAVYHSTKGGMNDIAGMEYKTGKFAHIYRPKAIDSKGQEVWCDISIDTDNGLLSVTIDQDFLDKAVYPVIVDPTFGYTTAGGSGVNPTSDTLFSLIETAPEAGVVTKLTVRSLNLDAIGGLYIGNDLEAPQTEEYHDNENGVQEWVDLTFSGTLNITAIEYGLGVLMDNEGIEAIYRDTGFPSGTSKTVSNLTFPTFPDPATFVDSTSKYSIYATYTASGGGTVRSVPQRMRRGMGI